MAKGIFSQGVCLLTDGKTTIEDIKAALHEHDFQIAQQLPARQDWRISGPSLLVPFLPAVNGYATVDVVNQPWPDWMGDAKSDPMTFGAWMMGFFGPYTTRGSFAVLASMPVLGNGGEPCPTLIADSSASA